MYRAKHGQGGKGKKQHGNNGPDIVIQVPNLPQLKGLETACNFYTEFFKILVSIEGGPAEIIISESGDMAWEYGWNRAVYEGPDGPIEDEGKYLEVWKKIDGKWEIADVLGIMQQLGMELKPKEGEK